MVFQLAIPENASHSFECFKCLTITDLSAICDLASNFILKQAKDIDFDAFSVGLQKDPVYVEQCVCVIVYMYTECIRNQVNPFDFGVVIRDVGIMDNHMNILEKVYNQISLSLKNHANLPTKNHWKGDVAEYSGLRWRLDVELSNKSMYHTLQPSFVLEVDSVNQGVRCREYFETDYLSLQSIVDTLENATYSSWDICCHNVHDLIARHQTTVMDKASP